MTVDELKIILEDVPGDYEVTVLSEDIDVCCVHVQIISETVNFSY